MDSFIQMNGITRVASQVNDTMFFGGMRDVHVVVNIWTTFVI